MRKLDLTQEAQIAGFESLVYVMNQLKFKRKVMGLSQRELAEQAGVSLSTVSKYERYKFPTRVVWLAALIHECGYKIELFERAD